MSTSDTIASAASQRSRRRRGRNDDACCGGEEEERIRTNATEVVVSDNYTNSPQMLEEKRIINVLRATVLGLLLVTTTLACVGVYLRIRQDERRIFEVAYETNARRILDSFHAAVEHRLAATHHLAASITSYALDKDLEFPMVTVPDFPIRGSALRVEADAMVVHWMPLVTDDKREAWEEYALANRFQIDEAFKVDAMLRQQQDREFGLVDEGEKRLLQNANLTVLDDGTGFHPRIWSQGSPSRPRGDEPEGGGPYLPLWQRSPVNGAKQKPLNRNNANTRTSHGILPVLLASKRAVMSRADILPPETRGAFKKNLALSQYRHKVPEVIDDPVTMIQYPVFDSFRPDSRKVAGVLMTNIYWKLFFKNILQHSEMGMVCVLENSFNQTLAYHINGPDVTYLGEDIDPRDAATDGLELSTVVNDHIEENAHAHNRAYLAASLNQEYGKYTLRIYPERDVEYSNRPWLYVLLVLAIFVFTSVVYIVFVFAVEKRQRILMQAAVESARKAAATERELNEFLAHEVRNPLAAAISACTFVQSAICDTSHIPNGEFKASLLDDVKIVGHSLQFVNDFLKSMLDSHRAAANQLELKVAPTDLLRDVLEPVSNMVYQRDSTEVDVIVECPENLVVATDCLRLKQVVLNLGRNSAKFVRAGFIRFRATAVGEEGNAVVQVHVEDSGPGIPVHRQGQLFQKYQTNLDVLGQGTGIGLNLCKNLMRMLRGDVWLDTSYSSGIEGSPGARFVVALNSPPVHLDAPALPPAQWTSQPSSKSLAAEGDIVVNTMEEGNGGEAGEEVDRPGNFAAQEDSELPEHLRVLFVDDDMMLRRLFSRAVRRVAENWTIHEAANGETALRLLAEEESNHHYDVIFMDQYMASTERQMLGTETVRALRARGYTSCTVCGLSANDVEHSFLSAGADYFLLKPIPCNEKDLRRELHRITARSRERIVDKAEPMQSVKPLAPLPNGFHPGGEDLSGSQQAESLGKSRNFDPSKAPSLEITELPENLSILFVDDDPMLRKLFSRAVQRVAPTWKIEQAANGETALHLADTETYNLIFMDQYMPSSGSTEHGLLGTETVRELRAKGVSSIICGLSANEVRQAFLSAGADFFLLKPIPCRENDLKRELRRIVLQQKTASLLQADASQEKKRAKHDKNH